MKEFVCPDCSADEIAELSICVVSHPVTKWSQSGEPEDYEMAVVDWESDYPYSDLFGRSGPKTTLECRRCGAHFETPKSTCGAASAEPVEPPTERKRYGCPNCLGEDIAEQCLIPVEYTGRFITNDKGQPEFESDGTDADVFWEREEPDKLPYRCRDCSHQFREPVVVTATMYKERRARNHVR